MDRRELLKMMAASIGGSVALPHSVFARIAEPLNLDRVEFFRPSQRLQVEALAEAIIPRTETPGARDAGVARWIEVILRDCYPADEQQMLIEGLAKITMACANEKGASIDQLTGPDQVAFLESYHQMEVEEAKASREPNRKSKDTFLATFKELVKFCYVNSEVGATRAFDFTLVPGRWVPDMKLEDGMRPPIWY